MEYSTTEEKVSVTGLLKVIYRSKLTIVIFVICFVVLGLFIYFLSPKEYANKTVLLPESSSNSGGLGALASLTGINLGKSDSKDRTLNPLVYESVLRSSPFLDRIVSKVYYFPTIDKEIKLSEYLDSYAEPDFTDKISKLLTFSSSKPKSDIVLPAASTDSVLQTDDVTKIFSNEILVLKNKGAIKKLDERLTYASDIQNGLITLSLDFQDPAAGAQVLEDIVSEFILFTMNYEGQKQDLNLEQLNLQVAEKKRDYDIALNRLAAFKDQNFNTIRAAAQIEGQRLQNEVSLALGVYNSLLQQREQLGILSSEKKSPISVIEPVQVATSPYRPRLILTLIISIFLGTLFGSIFVLSKKSIISIIE